MPQAGLRKNHRGSINEFRLYRELKSPIVYAECWTIASNLMDAFDKIVCSRQ